MDFNKQNFLNLLKQEELFKSQGKSLDETLQNKLISYQIMIEDQVFWESCEKYLKIFNLFISKTISMDQFLDQFYMIRSSNLESRQVLEKKFKEEALNLSSPSVEITVAFNSKSRGFEKLISTIYSLTDVYDCDVTLESNLNNPESIYYGMSEEYFRLVIESLYLSKLEKYCKKF